MNLRISKVAWRLIVFFIIIMSVLYYLSLNNFIHISYSDFQQLLRDGKLEEVTLGDHQITMILKSQQDYENLISKSKPSFISQLNLSKPVIATSSINDVNLIKELEDAKISINAQEHSKLLALLQPWLIPGIFIFSLLIFLISQKSSLTNLAQISKNNAKMYINKISDVTFKDVAGVDEAKDELIEVVEFLKNPNHYRRLGARAPKGVLLVGPPGTGKTLLARAVAGEAQVPFLSINGSEFVEMFVGVGAARVRNLFLEAHRLAPSIIFIDELDALGRQRDSLFHANDEREHTLNQLLSEMDGFDPNVNVILLSATNRPEVLDPALLRAGRFDRQVLVDKPDKRGREQILSLYLKKIQCAPNVNAAEIALLTPGFTGADLATLTNEAALFATRHNAKIVTMSDFNNVIERIILGLEKKNRLLNPKEREMTAYHEMGHALVAMVLAPSNPLHKVSIIQRGLGTLGYTMQRPTDDRYIVTKEELKAKIAIMLGGQAAEQVVYQQTSTGASDDLSKASNMASDMVMRYGMDKELGHLVYEKSTPYSRNFSEKTAQSIDEAVRKITQESFDKAVDIIKKNRDCLEEGVKLLLQKETLDKNDLEKLSRTANIV